MFSLQKIPLKIEQCIKESKKVIQRTRWRKQKNLNPPIFITKTYQILQNDIYNDIISWNEQGTNFIIINIERFEQQVLPIHFRHRNFSSFVRQLNMYDFHKIRNDNNVNIFEHKEFKKDHKELLNNIKRKGCNGKKLKENQNQDNMSISQHQEFINDNQETPMQRYINQNQEKYHKTIESIGRISNQCSMESLRFINASLSPSPQKKRKMQQFINNLPQIITSQYQIQLRIKQLKSDPNYECLNTKKDIRKIISKIRRKIPKKLSDDDLQELSIEEEILADKIDHDNQHKQMNPSLAILSTQKYLPKSINFIGSMSFCDDMEHLFFQKLY